MKTARALFLFVLLAIIITFPLVFNLEKIIIDLQDGLLITWILNWTISHPFDFNANIFYPYKNTLAFSETIFPVALIVSPFVKLFNQPLLAYNLGFLLALILTPFSVYLLTRSVFSSLIFTYSPIFFGYLTHIQVLNFWPVVLAVYFMTKKKYLLLALTIPVAATTSVLFLYFICLMVVIQSFLTRNLRPAAAFVIGSVLVLPLMLPYFAVSKTFNYVRPITDAIHNSVAPIDFLTQFFPGLAFIFLAFLWFRQNRRKFKTDLYFWTGVSSLVLSFGPALHLVKNTIHLGPIPFIPLPYTLFYYLLPGFSGIRTPSRFMLLTFFAFTVYLFTKTKLNKLSYLFLIIFIIAGLKVPIKYYQVPEIPKVNYELKEKYPGVPVVYFPIYGWWNEPQVTQETKRLYFSTVNWNPMYNGYSGFSPREWEERVKWLQKTYPAREAIDFLLNQGVELVVENNKITKIDDRQSNNY